MIQEKRSIDTRSPRARACHKSRISSSSRARSLLDYSSPPRLSSSPLFLSFFFARPAQTAQRIIHVHLADAVGLFSVSLFFRARVVIHGAHLRRRLRRNCERLRRFEREREVMAEARLLLREEEVR